MEMQATQEAHGDLESNQQSSQDDDEHLEYSEVDSNVEQISNLSQSEGLHEPSEACK